MSDLKKTRIKRDRRLVPESAVCHVGPAFVQVTDDHEFIVIAKDDESLRRAWELLGGEPDSLDMSECRQLAAFEYKATK